MIKKICGHCRVGKGVDEFFKERRRKDGYSYRCKACDRFNNRNSRVKNPKNYKAKNKRYYLEHREKILKGRAHWYKKNRIKVIAHEKVKRALYKGDLTRPKFCENYEVSTQCSDKIIAHHDDYLKPLKVRWLCTRCHMRHHYGK